jgi:hypothetical protein
MKEVKGGSPRVSKGALVFRNMDYEYDYNDFPLAYLITLRTYGTWLHGEKNAVDRHGYNIYKTPRRKFRTEKPNA